MANINAGIIGAIADIPYKNTSGAYQLGSAATVALLMGGGQSGDKITTPLADKNFFGFWLENSATSGDNRGLYMRFYLSGAGGGGECARLFTTVNNVAAGTAHGAHISLSFAETGTVTGLGVAMRATLHIANQATQAGTMAAVQAEVWSDGTTSDPAGSQLSAIRIVNDGNATGMADVDDDCAALSFAGWGDATGNMIYVHSITVGAAAGSVRIRVGSTSYYMYYWATEGS